MIILNKKNANRLDFSSEIRLKKSKNFLSIYKTLHNVKERMKMNIGKAANNRNSNIKLKIFSEYKDLNPQYLKIIVNHKLKYEALSKFDVVLDSKELEDKIIKKKFSKIKLSVVYKLEKIHEKKKVYTRLPLLYKKEKSKILTYYKSKHNSSENSYILSNFSEDVSYKKVNKRNKLNMNKMTYQDFTIIIHKQIESNQNIKFENYKEIYFNILVIKLK